MKNKDINWYNKKLLDIKEKSRNLKYVDDPSIGFSKFNSIYILYSKNFVSWKYNRIFVVESNQYRYEYLKKSKSYFRTIFKQK